jgi:hypothetical protein
LAKHLVHRGQNLIDGLLRPVFGLCCELNARDYFRRLARDDHRGFGPANVYANPYIRAH